MGNRASQAALREQARKSSAQFQAFSRLPMIAYNERFERLHGSADLARCSLTESAFSETIVFSKC